jgi:hypothetical protein
MVKHIKIVNVNFMFVFRHKFEKETEDNLIDKMLWRDYRLGFWYKRSKMVGEKDFKNPLKWGINLVNSYMFGIDLIWCKMWVEIDKGGMIIKEK